MTTPNRKRGVRYRFTTSMSAGALVALVLAWYGARHHHAAGPAAGRITGAVTLAVAVGVAMFVAWSAVALYRRAGERRRAAERERNRTGGRRRRSMAGVR